MIEDQLIDNQSFYTFGTNFGNYNLDKSSRKKPKPHSNVTIRKRKLFPITSEERLKDLPSVYKQIPTDHAKKIEAAKNFLAI